MAQLSRSWVIHTGQRAKFKWVQVEPEVGSRALAHRLSEGVYCNRKKKSSRSQMRICSNLQTKFLISSTKVFSINAFSRFHSKTSRRSQWWAKSIQKLRKLTESSKLSPCCQGRSQNLLRSMSSSSSTISIASEPTSIQSCKVCSLGLSTKGDKMQGIKMAQKRAWVTWIAP